MVSVKGRLGAAALAVSVSAIALAQPAVAQEAPAGPEPVAHQPERSFGRHAEIEASLVLGEEDVRDPLAPGSA